MLPPVTFVALDDADRQVLEERIFSNRRIIGRNKLIFFGVLLLLGLSGMLYGSLSPGSAIGQDILFYSSVTAFFCGPVVILVVFINMVMLVNKLPPLYRDKRNDVKKRIPFHPYPYCIPEVGRFYIKTYIKAYPFFPVTYETYQWINSSQVLYLEIGPKSGILFDIKAEDELYTINVDNMIKTPEEVKERVR